MADSQLEKLVERVPLPDGSTRRRLVAGTILAAGILWSQWPALRTALADVEAVDLLASPLLLVGALLGIYALGSLAEMLGESFLVRAAAGVFWALGFPGRSIAETRNRARKLAVVVLATAATPFILVGNLLLGLVGRTGYAISLMDGLTPSAQDLYGKLPARVASGLAHPVGDDAEMAVKHLIDLLPEGADRQWARRLLVKARDIAAVTTALYALAIAGLALGLLGPGVQARAVPDTVQLKAAGLRKSLSEWNEAVSGPLGRALAPESRERVERKLAQAEDLIGFLTLDPTANRASAAEAMREFRTLEAELRAELKQGVNAADRAAAEKLIDASQITPNADALQATVTRWSQERGRRETAAALQSAALGALLLLAYVGFFTCLRSALVSILESVAVQVPPSAFRARVA